MAKSGGKDKDVKYWFCYILDEEADSNLISRRDKKFPKLKTSEAQLKFHLTTLRTLNASLKVGSERVKDNERAQELRNRGNDLFSSNGDTAKAAEMYTKSIAYALPGSPRLALAYANRSAVSFKSEDYENCLLDIERSLENDYPDEMKAKLYGRKVRCLMALKKPKTEIEEALQDTRRALLKMDPKASGRDLVEKILTDKNHMAPTPSTKKTQYRMKPVVPQDDSCDIRGATGMSIRYSKKYGRHIIATRDIRPGEIIAVIDAYAAGRDPKKCYRECAHCTTGTTVGIPCDHCVNVIYCSTSCRDRAWNDYHEFECPILGIMYDLEAPTNTILAMRITLKAIREAGGVVELKKMLKRIDAISDPRIKGFTDDVFDCTKYACFYTLTSHAGKQNSDESYFISLLSTFTVYFLATRTEIFGQKYNSDLQVFDKNPLSVFLVELMIRNFEIIQMTSLRENEEDDNVLVSPFTALCNHSCDSNVTCLGTNKCIAFAFKPIKAGEQIWDNYRLLYYMHYPKAERQRLLKKHYHFTCDCVPCIENWPMHDQLPKATEMPGLSPEVRGLLLAAQRAFLEKTTLIKMSGNFLDIKDELVHLLELLYEHTYPCREMMGLRDWLMMMYGAGLDTS